MYSDKGRSAEMIRQRLDPPLPDPWLVEFRRTRRRLTPKLRAVFKAFDRAERPRSTLDALRIWQRRTGGSQATFYRRLQKLREAFQPAKNLHDGPRRRYP